MTGLTDAAVATSKLGERDARAKNAPYQRGGKWSITHGYNYIGIKEGEGRVHDDKCSSL